MTVRSAHVRLSKMADKQAKVTKRKKKRKPKDSHEFSLEDVLAVGGDKAGSILKSFFASGSIFFVYKYAFAKISHEAVLCNL